MHIGILGNRDSWYVAELSRACRERDHRAERLDYRTLMASENTRQLAGVTVLSRDKDGRVTQPSLNADLTNLDAVIVRTMPPGSLEQVVYRMDVLARLEQSGVKVVNSAEGD